VKAQFARWVAAVVLGLGALGLATAGTGAKDPDGWFHRLSEAHWIQQGHGKRLMYIFIDPNCPYCHRLYSELQPRIGPDDLTVRWIVVGILTTTSAGKAAAILSAKDPGAALERSERGFSGQGGGGIEETLPDDKTKAALEANQKLLSATGATGVPTIVFRNGQGRATKAVGGPSPGQLQRFLSHVH